MRSYQWAINMEHLARLAIESALNTGVSFADIRIVNTTTTVIEITNGVSKGSIASRSKGAGIRAFIDGAWAFAQTTDLSPDAMREIGISVARLALATRSKTSERFEIEGPSFSGKSEFRPKTHFHDISFEDKVKYVKAIDDQARDYDPRIVNTHTLYGERWVELFIANSLGTSVYVENSLPRIISTPTSKDGTNRQSGFKSVSMRGGFEVFQREDSLNIGISAAEHAIRLLDSKAVEGGVFDVILDPALNGVMTHEAFGHACEADNWLAHSTVLEDKVGKIVGPEYLSITDDPTLPHLRGSFEYDWEGTKASKHSLVQEGRLEELLHSLETSSRLGMHPNGSARAQSYMDIPIPRMSNTFMEPGDWSSVELIEDTASGLLLCGVNYGYTNPSKGQFVFQADHGYLITNGELGQLVRDVSVANQILDILSKIDAVAKDIELEAGTCGKFGQTVPDTTGGPHVRIRSVPVGGV